MPMILCIDFDGVIHSYTSGWKGAEVITDCPVPGAIAWLYGLVKAVDGDKHPKYTVNVYSSRSKEPGGVEAMRRWFVRHANVNLFPGEWLNQLHFPTEKPAAYLTIDDRAICFRGTFPSEREIDHFRPWNKPE